MSARTRPYLSFLVVFAVLGGIGLGAAVYILVHERLPLPFQHTYTLRARFTEANGVFSGIGQPVNVAGVKVGQVTGSEVEGGTALVSMEIDPGKLPRVYANARAALDPITPLEDMQVELNPGHPPARPLPAGATLPLSRTRAPVPVSDLLTALDADTRDYLSTLIASLGQGLRGRGQDLRQMLVALGPTAADARRITVALARRRHALARLVHNLALVMQAASHDHQLASLVEASNQTLAALAGEDRPLRQALAKLPPTLAVARATLLNLRPFAKRLGPTLDALAPAVRRLPATLRSLRPFAALTTHALRRRIRPLVRDATPLAGELAQVVPRLSRMTPHLSRSFQVLEYLVNELAYNPPGNDEGFLFWLAWFVHNFNSVTSSGDAHGGIGRAFPLVSCEGLQDMPNLQAALGVTGLCPK